MKLRTRKHIAFGKCLCTLLFLRNLQLSFLRKHQIYKLFLIVTLISVGLICEIKKIGQILLASEKPISTTLSSGNPYLSTETRDKNIRRFKLTSGKPRIITLDSGDPYLSTETRDEDISRFKLIKKDSVKDAQSESPEQPLRFYDTGKDSTLCVPMEEWQKIVRPTCNSFHEIDMADGFIASAHGTYIKENRNKIKIYGKTRKRYLEKLSLLGYGGWRSVFKLGHLYPNGEEIVLKTLRWENQEFDPVTYQRSTVEAQITEHLTSSPSIIDTYGFCGESLLNELATGGTLQSLIKGESRSGTLTPRKKAEYARDVAKAVSVAHGGDNATFAHTDIKPDNIVIMENGALKLNDFDSGRMLHWNISSSSQCYFRKLLWNPTMKSNEEVREYPLTEKIDVYALGGIFYYILTNGKKPYFGVDWKTIQILVARGILPNIPKKYNESNDPFIVGMLRVMRKCHKYYPEDRPSASAIAHELDMLLRNN